MRILLADDAKNIVLVLKMSLEKAGYQVLVSRDGLTALEIAQIEKPDLILLDILMPKMNGFLVLEALKDDPQTNEIPVVFISAKAEEKDIERAKSLGVNDYLIKPIKQKDLLAVVEKNLGGGNVDE
ncbi:response regulator [Halocella sp. SP3-1]|uniref:response regulator n=1 Tax=Halocella sp. SP3-1 TaxID=2382161 RepID=UPI000F7578B2|nr:response regulator [Halocella sp. SP3-1]AZO95431.1 response regulator [Halocella sp. SP3-1]